MGVTRVIAAAGAPASARREAGFEVKVSFNGE